MQSLFGVMEEHNYTLQSLSYTNPSQVEEDTSFIAVFALSINAMASYMGHFDLNASQVEEMLFTSTEANISKIKIFMGYQTHLFKVGTTYIYTNGGRQHITITCLTFWLGNNE